MFLNLSNDPFFSALRNFGYNMVSLPKSTIKPLQLLTKKGNDLTKLGEFSPVFIMRGNVGKPDTQNSKTPNISGQKSGNLSFGLGLSLLSSFISGSGGPVSPLETKYQQANSIAFQYDDVYEDSIQIAQLDQFLNDVDINPFSKHVANLLESDQVYIITATLKSNKFTVTAKTSKGISLNLNVPALQVAMAPNVRVTSDSASSSVITFEGHEQLIFGFQAVQIFYDKGCYTRIEPISTKVKMLGPKAKGPKPISEAPFINLNE